MADRSATIKRDTKETQIELSLNLDGSGIASIDTPVGFLNHMLEALAKHSSSDLTVIAKGDTHIDAHHTVEDTGICIGLALKEALGNFAGIERYGSSLLPMDETLVEVALDLCNRSAYVYNVDIEAPRVGEFDTELAEEFFAAVAGNTPMNLHINKRYGKNAHHIIEACFKGFARALRQAKSITNAPNTIMSTKGVL